MRNIFCKKTVRNNVGPKEEGLVRSKCFITVYIALILFFLLARQPQLGQDPLFHEVTRSHTTTHHSRQDSSRKVISSSQRPLPDNSQHSIQTEIHASGGIRTHNFSRRAAADLRLRPRGHWDRYSLYLQVNKIKVDYIGRKCRPNRHENVRNICDILVGRVVGKKLRQTPTSKWQCNNIVDIKGRGLVILTGVSCL